jgi:hypothetical protein
MVMTEITDENAHENEDFLRIEALAEQNGFLLIPLPPGCSQLLLVDLAVGPSWAFYDTLEEVADYVDSCAAGRYLAEADTPADIDEYLAERELGGGGPLAQDPLVDPEIEKYLTDKYLAGLSGDDPPADPEDPP